MKPIDFPRIGSACCNRNASTSEVLRRARLAASHHSGGGEETCLRKAGRDRWSPAVGPAQPRGNGRSDRVPEVARLPPLPLAALFEMTQESREEACRRGHLALRLVCALTAMTLTPEEIGGVVLGASLKRGELVAWRGTRRTGSPRTSGCVAIPDRARGAAARPGTRRSAVRKALIGAGDGGLPLHHVREHGHPPGWSFQRGAADNDLPRNNAKRASQIYSTFSSLRGELNSTKVSTGYL